MAGALTAAPAAMLRAALLRGAGACLRHHAQAPGPGRAQLMTVFAVRTAHSPTSVHWPATDSQRSVCVGRNVAQQAGAGTNSAPDSRSRTCCLRARIENIPGHQAELLSEVYPELGAQTCWYAGAVRKTAAVVLFARCGLHAVVLFASSIRIGPLSESPPS